MSFDWQTLLPVLVHIQAHLDEDLTLRVLAMKSGFSQFHFQRVFARVVGESPKAFVLRLRLERAAFRLLLHESRILDIALESGFQNHESFSRAFRQRFGTTPASFRDASRLRRDSWFAQDGTALDCPAGRFELSETKVVRLRPLHVAFRRHVGPYESVPDTIFEDLEAWAARRLPPGPRVWLGIGHDSPATTHPDKLRYDAGLRVDGPFASEGEIAYQLLPGGPFAVTTHAGPYATLPQAYAAIFPRLFALKGWKVQGLPAIEFYNTSQVSPGNLLNHTDVCLPVAPLAS